jgi:hypothetical protein
MFAVSRTRLYQLLRSGALGDITVGRSRLIDLGELERLITAPRPSAIRPLKRSKTGRFQR